MLPSVLSEKRWQKLLMLILIGIAQSVCLFGLVAVGQRFVNQTHFDIGITEVVVAVFAITLLSGGRFFERYIAEVWAQEYVSGLREQVFKKTFSLPVTDRDMVNRGGSLLRLTSDMTAIRNWIVQGLAPLVVLGIWFFAALVGLFQLHFILGVGVLASVVIAMTGNFFIGRFLYSTSEKARRRRSVLIRETSEKIRRFYLVKMFNQYGKERRSFAKRSKRLLGSNIRKAKASAVLRGFNEAILLGTLFTILLLGLHLSQNGLLSGQSLAVVLTASLYLLSQMRRLSRLYELWTLQKVAEDKLAAFFKRKEVDTDGRQKLPSKALSIKLRKISVNGRFKRFSASLTARSRVAMTESQGCGKSSLLMALAGLLPIEKGRFVINGRDSANFHPELWSKTVALVGNELPLIRGDWAINLFYGARKVEESFTQHILSITGLNADMNMQEENTVSINEAGSNLNSGLRFRLMLARALLRRPRLLLIEDDTALRDPSIQRVLIDVFRSFDGAIVIAADIPELSTHMTDFWKLQSSVDRRKSLPVENNNILPFTVPFNGEGK